jgi:small GTP-binding protein
MAANRKTGVDSMLPFNVVVMGTGSVGKSALVVQFTTNTFVEDYDPTVEDSFRKDVVVDGKTSVLDILDTAGQEEFESLYDRWVRPAHGFLLMYSLTLKATFEEVQVLKDKIVRIKDTMAEANGSEEAVIPMVLVGNKSDLEEDREVTHEEGKAIADKWGCAFFETSAKTKKNVHECTHQLIREIRTTRPDSTKKQKKKAFCTIL